MCRGNPAKWRLSFMGGRRERVEPLDRAHDLSSLGREVEAVARGDRSMQQCRATHSPVGLAVTPRIWTRRMEPSSTNSTYRRLSKTVSAWKKSQAKIPSAWAARNCCQVRL